MKKQSGKTLVEILAVELKEWPKGFMDVGQAFEGCLYLPGIGEHIRHTRERYTLSSDWLNAIVTRAQWEAERAKLSKPKANAQGWVRNRGRKNPFDTCTLVDARLRSGEVVVGKFSENLHWLHTGNHFDVMAYRVNESVEAAEPEVTAPNDGPLQWRDRIREIDVVIRDMGRERKSLVDNLAAEGLALIGHKAQ